MAYFGSSSIERFTAKSSERDGDERLSLWALGRSVAKAERRVELLAIEASLGKARKFLRDLMREIPPRDLSLPAGELARRREAMWLCEDALQLVSEIEKGVERIRA